MNRDEVSAITHGDLAWHNPIDDAKADAALGLLELAPGDRVLDVGCGQGELLVRLAERYGVAGVGVDLSEPAIAAARAKAAARVPDARLELVVGDAHELAGGEHALVACIGSMHAIGGFGALAAFAAPGGWVLVGDGYWRREPGEEYLAALGGASPDELPDYAGLLRAAAAAGLRPVHASVASDDDWDRYEWQLVFNGERYVAEHPGEPGADVVRAWVDRARERLLVPGGRDTLGFALVLLRREAGA